MSVRGFVGRRSGACREDEELYELKSKAAEFYRINRVPQRIEGVLNDMFLHKPTDIYGYLANYFSQFSHPPVISKIAGRQVYDRRGETALHVDVFCIIRNEEKLVCSAVISDVDVLESGDVVTDSNHKQVSVATALEWIRDQLNSMLCGFNPAQQTHLDKLLSDFLRARYLEAQAAHDKERKTEEEEVKSEAASEVTPPALSQKDNKKGADKGKKRSNSAKPIPPPEPLEPQFPGAMVVAAVSLAVAKSAASLTAQPLYKHIITLREPQEELSTVFLPVPLITVLSCGKGSAGKLNLLEEVILLPTAPHTPTQIIGMGRAVQTEIKRISNTIGSKAGPAVLSVSEGGALQVGLDRPEQALDMVTEACANLGMPVGKDLRLVVNCAAHVLMDYPKGKYEVMTGTLKSPAELVDTLAELVQKYPAIAVLIDPFRKEDVEQWDSLRSLVGQSCCLAADAGFSPRQSWRTPKPVPPGVTWVILKHSSDMTVTDILHLLTERREDGETILALNSDEVGDDSTVDIAVGLGVSFLKLGGLSGGGRMNKCNRLLRIEQDLEEQGIRVGMQEVTLPWVTNDEEEEEEDEEKVELSNQEEELNTPPDQLQEKTSTE